MAKTPSSRTPRHGSAPTKADAQKATQNLSSPDPYAETPIRGTSWVKLTEEFRVDGRDPLLGTSSSGGELPTIPGFTIVREIGRGGMGVVYQAEQQSLHRPVALKMILRGYYATTEERVRFMIEAEMLARVKHPNIVQVYEVGTHDNFPFLSLELVEGGTLAEFIQGKPQPPRQAASLLAILADAVQAAHSQGIIHRDLKPGNVLLHRQSSEATDHGPADQPTHLRSRHHLYGIPKITDFGLAKKFDDDSHLTTTGHVLGTPSYMAPEQALGHRDVGPAADLYALGVILYEMLTGEPPFRAANSMETLQQVINQEPPPLDRPGVTVPRDLAVICLKCLHKEPARRYRSAASFADDLNRFLRDEPITARPISRRERFQRWCRRNPDKAALAAGCVVATVLGFAGVVWKWREAVAERAKADAARILAEKREAQTLAVLRRTTLELNEADLRKLIDQAEARDASTASEELQAFHKLRTALLSRAHQLYQSLLEDPNDPELRFDLARVSWRLGNAGPNKLPDGIKFEALLGEAVALLEQLATEAPDKAIYFSELAQAQEAWGRGLKKLPTQAPGALEKAEGLLCAAIANQKRAIAVQPNNRELRKLLALHFYLLHEIRLDLERSKEESAEPLMKFIAMREEQARELPQDEQTQVELGGAYRKLQYYYFRINETEGVREAGARAEAILSRSFVDASCGLLARFYLCEVISVRGSMYEINGDYAEALATYRAYRAASVMSPVNLRARFLSQYGACAAHAGEVAEGAMQAEELLRLAPASYNYRLNAFCILASCYQTAVNEEVAEAFVVQAETVARALMADHQALAAHRCHIAEEIEESGLRHHPRFIAIRRQLESSEAPPGTLKH